MFKVTPLLNPPGRIERLKNRDLLYDRSYCINAMGILRVCSSIVISSVTLRIDHLFYLGQTLCHAAISIRSLH